MRRMSVQPRTWPSLAFAAIAASASASAGDAALDSARLSNLVRQDCGSCHGLTLNGGLGKPLTSERLRDWSKDQLVSIILDGVPGTPMPPWRPLISEPDARWIVDRLKQGDMP